MSNFGRHFLLGLGLVPVQELIDAQREANLKRNATEAAIREALRLIGKQQDSDGWLGGWIDEAETTLESALRVD